MKFLVVFTFLFLGWLLSEVQHKHVVRPFLSRKGFNLVSLGSFACYMLGAFASLGFFFERI
ncbi:MAG: hypothetical protein WD398_00620 [Cyclobacteriaceae bacterium]